MMRLVRSTDELPEGSHSLAFFGSRPEAARNMGGFLRGARDRGQPAYVMTSDAEMFELYRAEVARRAPEMSGALHRIPGRHALPTADGMRPLPEVMEYAAAHPEGVSMCGDTIPGFLDRRNLGTILEYENWFDGLRPFRHRGLCPYDVGALPVDRAPETFARLAHAHSHAVLSDDPNPGVRFLQLLILPHVDNPPAEHLGWLARAVDYGLVSRDGDGAAVGLTARGEDFARALLALPAYARAADGVAHSRRRFSPESGEGPGAPRFAPDS